MTKKDYVLIAYCLFTANITGLISDEFRDSEEGRAKAKTLERDIRKKQAEWFAYNLSKGNPRFDNEKFIKACGIEEPD